MDTHKLDKEETRRRRREGFAILIVAISIVILTYIETHISDISSLPVGSNILIFGLININIILLILLVFLVLRNFVKLVFERRRRVMGSRLRTKLVVAFVGLSIVPTLLLFFIAIGFITRSIENWFEIKVEDSLKDSLEIAQSYYKDTSDRALYFAREFGLRIERGGLLIPPRANLLRGYLEDRMKENGISTVEVFSSDRERVAYAIASNVNKNLVPDIEATVIKEALRGEDKSLVQSFEKGDVVRGVFPILLKDNPGVAGAVVVSYYVPKNLTLKMKGISSVFEAYKQLKVLKNPIKASYLTLLLIITLVIVFLASWMGFYLAKGITVPIQELAEGTHQVASGNLDYRIEGSSSDEIGVLVKSFNKMTEDLKAGKSRLEEANLDLEQRRRYMEIVLRNVTTGVVSIDGEGKITTINRAAEELLGLTARRVSGKNCEDVLKLKDAEFLDRMMAEMKKRGVENLERQIKMDVKGKTVPVLLNLTMLKDENGNYLGMVVALEGLSDLLKTQRMMAWKEVAQRIAHEVKNPLTPIQLCAQRLSKKYRGRFSGEEGRVFDECTRTIIKQVDELKALVDAFSNFARMPAANPAPNDINEIIEEVTALYGGNHRNISINLNLDRLLPILEVDRDQMKRAFINLIDNAIASIEDGNGLIILETHYDVEYKIARIEVADTGCGIPPADKEVLFEPYFSTKRSGTGLGLAIVSDIVTDHRGYIRVKDNIPKGTRFIIELPVKGVSV
ncbi:MAG: HAMP domain-containing protein [Deltaproteobacteria bacterium]|nr:HAMP domain-containing protein [Deltaproteobacteria bacterium]